MYPIFGTPENYELINKECKLLVEQIFSRITPSDPNKMLAAQQILYNGTGEKGMVYVLKEGIIASVQDDRSLYFYDAGDLVGLEQACSNYLGALKTDFAVIGAEYRISDILKAIAQPDLTDKWLRLLSNRYELLNIMVAVSAQTKLEAHPETLTLQPGEIIIEQGTSGTDVFTLVEGLLEVLVDGVKVGEVMPDEIFGAMAALTETPRSATVVAAEFSMVLKLPRERFLDLMKSRPLTVLKMIEDMSRTIVSLNERVVELSSRQ